MLCGPHRGGVSDLLADCFLAGLRSEDCSPRIVAIRDYPIPACDNCGYCEQNPGRCKYGGDAASAIFAKMLAAPLIIISAPIYFYNVPAHFKALIDRSQTFWRRPRSETAIPAAILILCAARERGEKLFSCARLTIGYFLATLGLGIRETICRGGLEKIADVSPETRADLSALGRRVASEIAGRR